MWPQEAGEQARDDPPAGVLDILTSTDEEVSRLRQQVEQLANMQQELATTVADAATAIGGVSGGATPKEIAQAGDGFPFELSANVPASTTSSDPYETSFTVPYDGRIEGVVLGWPDGASGLAGVRVRKQDGTQFIPRNQESGFLSANDFTYIAPVSVAVNKGDVMVGQFTNGSPTNTYLVNVFVNLIEMEEEV